MTDPPERPGTDVMASLPAHRPQRRSSKRTPRPDGNGTAKVTYAMKWPAVAGTYQVSSVATKAAACSSTATSFVVQ